MAIKGTIQQKKNGSTSDYYPKTSADQVQFTKTDGTSTTVQSELSAQNSAFEKLLRTDGSDGSAAKFYKYPGNLIYDCYGTGFYIYPGYETANGAPDDWGGLLLVYKTPESFVKFAFTRGGAIYYMRNTSSGSVDQSWAKICGAY